MSEYSTHIAHLQQRDHIYAESTLNHLNYSMLSWASARHSHVVGRNAHQKKKQNENVKCPHNAYTARTQIVNIKWTHRAAHILYATQAASLGGRWNEFCIYFGGCGESAHMVHERDALYSRDGRRGIAARAHKHRAPNTFAAFRVTRKNLHCKRNWRKRPGAQHSHKQNRHSSLGVECGSRALIVCVCVCVVC